ncbi:MAG: nucleotidyltransferase domain-containing protein [Gammaproteobacteria bacterium]|nr:nucleotidyltransferase domain-containing protein [Gammaproteobacteria bacterium]
MRLTQKQIEAIKSNFNNVFGRGKIFLFGSRTDDSKRGGDIDLYIVADEHENLVEKKVKFLVMLKREIGQQKIDVVLNYDQNRLIEVNARREGVLL